MRQALRGSKGCEVARTVLAVLEREVDSGEVLKLVLPLLVEHRQHVGARAREDEPSAADVAPRLEEHGDRGRVDGGAAVKVEQQAPQPRQAGLGEVAPSPTRGPEVYVAEEGATLLAVGSSLGSGHVCSRTASTTE